MNGEKTDNALMNEFKGCSIVAYNQIVQRYKQRIFNYVLRTFLYGSTDDSEEVVQKTLIRVFEYKYKYVPKNEFSTWIFTISRNFALNELKRKKGSELNDDMEIAPQDTIDVQLKEILLSKIRSLPPACREIIELRYLQDLDYIEIARITKKNINTLKSHTKRCLDRLRDGLEGYGIDEKDI